MNSRIPEKWYETESFGDDVSLIRETYIASWLRCNIWHVKGKTHDLVIDSGMGLRSLKKEISALNQRPVICISSHCHFDHIGGAYEFDCRLGHKSERNIHADPTAEATGTEGFIRAETFKALPYDNFSHENYAVTPAPLTSYIDEGDVVDLGNRHFNVLHLPGHSPGSIALWEEATGILFSGDAIYDGDLYDSLYHSDKTLFRQSLARLKDWPVNTVHGGHHGSFGRERMKKIIDNYFNGIGIMGDPEKEVSAWIEQEKMQPELKIP